MLMDLNITALRALKMREAEAQKKREQKAAQLADKPTPPKPGETVKVQKKKTSHDVEFVRFHADGKTAYVKTERAKRAFRVPVKELRPAAIAEEKTPEEMPATEPEKTPEKPKKNTAVKEETPKAETTPPKIKPTSAKCAPGAFFCNQTEINTRSKAIPAYYAIYELDTLVTSHNPESFSKNPAYPENCQQRDYTDDASEKNKVEQIARNLKPQIVITNDPTAANGAPMVTPEGIVLGGNGRTMGLKLFAKRSSVQEQAAYRNYLKQSAHIFGLDEKELEGFRFPVLVRVVDAPMTECALYSNILNESLTQEVDFTTKTISLARQLQPEDLAKIAGIFEGSGLLTFAELMQSRRAVTQFIELLRKRNVINSQNIAQFLDPRSGMPSPLGRLNLERILLGAILTKKELIDAAQNYTNAIIRALPILVKLQSLDAKYNLIPKIEEAIKLEAERRVADQAKAQFLTQTAIGRDIVSEDVRIVWDALDAGQLAFKRFCEKYAKLVENESEDGFGFYEKRSALDMLRLAGKEQKDSGLNDKYLEQQPKSMNVLRRMKVNYLSLTRVWRDFFGSLEESFSMLIWGLPGMGKSSFILLFLQELQRIGACLYLTTEETQAKIAHKAGVMNVRSTGYGMDALEIKTNPYQAIQYYAGSGKYQFIVVDSISEMKMTAEQAQYLINTFPHVNFTFISHSNKDGRAYAGAKEIAHKVDVVIKIDEGIATTVKNRFGETGREFTIFTKKR
jgi:hypothetical protein